jgi:hypothetical protein
MRARVDCRRVRGGAVNAFLTAEHSRQYVRQRYDDLRIMEARCVGMVALLGLTAGLAVWLRDYQAPVPRKPVRVQCEMPCGPASAAPFPA